MSPSTDPVLLVVVKQVDDALGERRHIGRRNYSDSYADRLFRTDPEIHRLLIQARLIKKSITRLSNHMSNKALTVDDKERILNMIEHKRELLRLARTQVKYRKQLLDQLIAAYRVAGVPDWDNGKPGMRLSNQTEELVRLGRYIRNYAEEQVSNNVSGKSVADLNRIIADIDSQLAVLGTFPVDIVQRKLLLRQKFKIVADRDALLASTPGSLGELVYKTVNSVRPLDSSSYLPLAWNGNYPVSGLVPLRRAFNALHGTTDSDFIPQTVREVLVDGKVSNKDQADFVTGIVTVL